MELSTRDDSDVGLSMSSMPRSDLSPVEAAEFLLCIEFEKSVCIARLHMQSPVLQLSSAPHRAGPFTDVEDH